MNEPPQSANPARPEESRPSLGPATRKGRPLWRRWWVVAGGVLTLLALLILLAPTLASTGPVRSVIVGKINGGLNGKLQVADWSLGWTTGTRLSGVKMFDPSGQLILEVGRVDTQLSLLQVVRGNLHAGEVTVDGLSFLARREADGQINFGKLAKTKSESKPSEPLPDISGRLTLKNAHGTYEDVLNRRTVHFDSIAATANIPDINGPIEHSLEVAARSTQGGSGSLKLKGSSDVIENYRVNLASARLNEVLNVDSFDNAGLSPLIPASILNTLTGTTSGSVSIAFDQPTGGTVEARIVSKDLAVGGPALKGEKIDTRELVIVVPKTTISMPATPAAWQDWKFSVGGTAAGSEPISISIAQATEPARVSVGGTFTPRQLLRLQERMVPDGQGAVAFAANADFGELARRLPKSFAALAPALALESGKFNATARASYSGPDVTLEAKATLSQLTAMRAGLDNRTLPSSNRSTAAGPGFQNYDLSANVALTARLGEQATQVSANTLEIKDNQELISISKTEQPLSISFKPGSNVKPSGSVNLNVNVARAKRLLSELQSGPTSPAAAAAGSNMTSGRLQGTLQVGAADDAPLTLQGDFALNGVSVITEGKPIENENLNLKLNLKAAQGFDALSGTINVRSRLIDLDVSELRYLLSLPPNTAGLFPQLQTVTAQARVADLGQLHDFLVSLSPKPPPGRDTAGPTQLRDGSATIQIALSREGPTAVVNAGVSGKDIAVKTNGVFRQIGGVDLKLAAKASPNAAPADTPMLARMGPTQVSTFSLAAAGSHVELAKPLVVENLSAFLNAMNGQTQGAAAPAIAAELAGQLALGPAQEAVEGLTGNRQSDRYQGRLDFRETLATGPQGLSAKGEARLHDLRFQSAAGQAVVEKEVGMVNDLMFDTAGSTLSIGTIALDTPATRAVVARVSGKIKSVSTIPAFENLLIEVQSDQSQNLWALLQPIFASAPDPATAAEAPGTSAQGIKLTGVSKARLELAGSYPLNQPFRDAVRTLKTSGYLSVEKFDGFGATAQNVTVGLNLQNAKLTLSHPNGLPKVNGGDLNIAGATIDLGQLHPRLSMPANLPLATNISINPVLADSIIGRFVNPIFANTDRAEGLLSVTVVSCTNQALDYLRNSPLPAESGRTELLMTLKPIVIGVPELASAVNQVFPNAFNEKVFEASIDGARIVIERGQVQNQLTLVADQKFPLQFSGGIGLLKNEMSGFKVSLPPALIARVNKSFAKYVPQQGLVVPLAGSTDDWMDNLGETIQPIATQLAAQALGDRVLPGLGGATTQPAGSPEEAIGGLLENLLGQKAKETDAQKDARRQKVREERAKRAQEKAAATTQPAEAKKKKKK